MQLFSLIILEEYDNQLYAGSTVVVRWPSGLMRQMSVVLSYTRIILKLFVELKTPLTKTGNKVR